MLILYLVDQETAWNGDLHMPLGRAAWSTRPLLTWLKIKLWSWGDSISIEDGDFSDATKTPISARLTIAAEHATAYNNKQPLAL